MPKDYTTDDESSFVVVFEKNLVPLVVYRGNASPGVYCYVSSLPIILSSLVTSGRLMVSHGFGADPVVDCPFLPHQLCWWIAVVRCTLTFGINRRNTLIINLGIILLIVLRIILSIIFIPDGTLLLSMALSSLTSPSKSPLFRNRIFGTL